MYLLLRFIYASGVFARDIGTEERKNLQAFNSIPLLGTHCSVCSAKATSPPSHAAHGNLTLVQQVSAPGAPSSLSICMTN